MSNDEPAPPSTELAVPEQPQIVSTVDADTLEKMKASMPTGQGGAIELEGMAKNLPDLLGAILAFWEKEVYSILERTSLTQEEIPIFTNLIHVAGHGIGGDLLDIPEPEVGQRVVFELRARRSLRGVELGASSVSFEHVMTAWLNVLRQREEQKLKEAQQMVGFK